jgi:hypothetical protein
MHERPETFTAADEDPEATLAAPRFDADDARRAHPVVPLADAPPRVAYTHAHGPRRAWMPALLAVALLLVAAVGGAVVTNIMRGPRTEQVQEQTQTAPAQTAKAPPQPSAAAEAPRAEKPAKPATHDARPNRARAAAALAADDSVRDDVEDYQDEERRGKGVKKRRERDDEVEKETRKEVRKALKRADEKAPRLVDVLTPP